MQAQGRTVMNRCNTLLTATAIAIAVMASAPAMAAGTMAGATITNTAVINYKVDGTVGAPVNVPSNTVTVDRVINLTVGELDPATTKVLPGETRAVVAFGLMNTSNATLDFLPTVVQPTGGAAVHGGTDTFNVTNGGFFVDSDGNGVFDSAADAALTFFDELPADTMRTFFYVADIPTGLANGSVAGITLTVTAREGGAAGTQGAALVQTTGASTAAVDTVFADGAGATDAARDGAFSARDDYTVLTPILSAVRTNTAISDPVSGTTNPKYIPGATVEYCFAVSNPDGNPQADDVVVTDTLGADLTFSPGSIYVNGTVTNGVCNADGTPGGTFAAGKVTGTLSSIPPGQIRTLRYRATVN